VASKEIKKSEIILLKVAEDVYQNFFQSMKLKVKCKTAKCLSKGVLVGEEGREGRPSAFLSFLEAQVSTTPLCLPSPCLPSGSSCFSLLLLPSPDFSLLLPPCFSSLSLLPQEDKDGSREDKEEEGARISPNKSN
jgi:hypothetical protein